MITILSIGKKHEPWVATGIERYSKRLQRPWDIKWELLPHSSLKGDKARKQESERILNHLQPSDYVILLDETGSKVDSLTFSHHIEGLFAHGFSPIVVIGGAYGVSTQLKSRANLVLSLSSFVFPHQLVRLIIVEQLYRAEQITRGSAYHHQ